MPSPPPRVPQSPHRFEGVSRTHEDYQAHALPHASPAPPSGGSVYVPNPNRFEGRTTNQDSYPAWPIDPPPAGPTVSSGYVPSPHRFEGRSQTHEDFPAYELPPAPPPTSGPAFTPNPHRFEGRTTTADSFQRIELPAGVAALGVETEGGKFHELISAGTLPPAQGSAVFTTTRNQQTEVVVKALCKAGSDQVHCLGSFELGGISPNLMGIPQVLVTFDLDAARILYVSAVDHQSHHRRSLTIRPRPGSPLLPPSGGIDVS